MNILRYENYHENKIHGDPSFPYTTYICTIPDDFTLVPLHWHEEIEIIYIKKGRGQVSVNLMTYNVKAGSIVLVLPGQLHSISQQDTDFMEYENIIVHPKLLISTQHDYCNLDFFQPLFAGSIRLPAHFTEESSHYSELSATLDACDTMSDSKVAGYRLYLKAKLYELFFILDRYYRQDTLTATSVRSLEKMKPVLKYIELHYNEQITISTISKIASLSESHFMRSFKETFGCSFINYLNDYRLTMAARLLRITDHTVISIASSVGYDNLSYFNRSFKAKYGLPPSRYRK